MIRTRPQLTSPRYCHKSIEQIYARRHASMSRRGHVAAFCGMYICSHAPNRTPLSAPTVTSLVVSGKSYSGLFQVFAQHSMAMFWMVCGATAWAPNGFTCKFDSAPNSMPDLFHAERVVSFLRWSPLPMWFDQVHANYHKCAQRCRLCF